MSSKSSGHAGHHKAFGVPLVQVDAPAHNGVPYLADASKTYAAFVVAPATASSDPWVPTTAGKGGGAGMRDQRDDEDDTEELYTWYDDNMIGRSDESGKAETYYIRNSTSEPFVEDGKSEGKGKGKGKFQGKGEKVLEGMRFKKQKLKDGTVSLRRRKVMTSEEREARDSQPLDPMSRQAVVQLIREKGSVSLSRVTQLLPGVCKKQLDMLFDVTPSNTSGNWEVTLKGDGPSPAKKIRTTNHSRFGGNSGGGWAWEDGNGGKAGWGGNGYGERVRIADMSEMFWNTQSPEAWGAFSGHGGQCNGKGQRNDKGRTRRHKAKAGLFPGDLVRNKFREQSAAEGGSRARAMDTPQLAASSSSLPVQE